MCLYCNRVCINHRGVSDLINNKLYVPTEPFPQLVREGIVLMDKISFFVHFHSTFSMKRKQNINNFGVLYYESISSLFLLYKTYLEILCRIVYNFVDKKVLPLFINDGFSVCRNITVCDQRLCQGSRQSNKFIIYHEMTDFCLRFGEIYSISRDPRFCQCLSDFYFSKISNRSRSACLKKKRKKKIVHIAFEKLFMIYSFFDKIISFIEQYCLRRKLFFQVMVLSILARIKT